MKLDHNGQFVTLDGKETGVYTSRSRGRWQYRSASGTLYASGMTPGEFVLKFWMRSDFHA